MAASVLVIQGIVEQNAALANRRILRDKSTFSQVLAALLRNNRSQNVFALLSAVVNNLAVFEGKPEVFNNLAGMNQRQRRVNSAVYLAIVWCGKDFLSRNVGEEQRSILCFSSTTLPKMSWIHTNSQISPI